MDINDLRSIMTVLSFLTFLGIVAWAFSGRRKTAYDEAARSLFDDEELASVNKSASKAAGH
jgi:cytochrome c oxidase cbb3-type subunit 4